MDINTKYNKLQELISEMGNLAIGFSGGVDSTLLAKVAADVLGEKALCITLHEKIHSSDEISESKELIERIGVKQIIVTKDITQEDFIKNNPIDRCYYCKHAVFSTIREIAAKHHITNIADGSNMDDLNDYRPGMKAIKELGIRSPLKEAGLTKPEIRELSKRLDLPTWNKPAFACLASRIPYGQEINNEKLMMVEKAEQILREKGIIQFRVRHHGEIARIEVAPDEREKLFNTKVLDMLSEAIKKIGFKYVAIEASGYRMGSLNQ